MAERTFKIDDDNARYKIFSKRGSFYKRHSLNIFCKNGYEFLLTCSEDRDSACLTVKPDYVDKLWHAVAKCPYDPHRPDLFRLPGQTIARYDLTRGGFSYGRPRYTWKELELTWQEMYDEVMYDIRRFLAHNPDSETFVPAATNIENDPDHLCCLMILLHQRGKDDVIRFIREAPRHSHRNPLLEKCNYMLIADWCGVKDYTEQGKMPPTAIKKPSSKKSRRRSPKNSKAKLKKETAKTNAQQPVPEKTVRTSPPARKGIMDAFKNMIRKFITKLHK